MRARLFRVMFAFGAIILIISAALSMALIRSAWRVQADESFSRFFAQFNGMLEMRMLEVNQITFTMINDSRIRKLASMSYYDKYDEYLTIREADKFLNTMFTYNKRIRFCIIQENGGLLYTNIPKSSIIAYSTGASQTIEKYTLDMDGLRACSWYQSVSGIPAGIQHYIYDFALPGFDVGDGTISALYKYQYSGRQSGYLILTIDSRWLDPIFESPEVGCSTVILSDSGGIMYSSGDAAPELAAIATGLTDGPSARDIRIGDGYYTAHCKHSDAFGMWVITVRDSGPLRASLLSVLLSVAGITAMLILVSLIVSARLSRRIAGPITDIALALETSPTDVHISPSPKADAEITLLAERINEMSLRIRLLISNMLDTQTAKNNAIVYALKQQVNPHFLYNILETISSMALIQGLTDVASITAHLGGMFRYSLENGSSVVPLERELAHLTDYLEINRLRGIRFQTDVDIPSEFMDRLVPRLIMQPLVENSFKHGFKGQIREWRVSIRACPSPVGFRLVFEDNGVGMSAERLDEVRESLMRPGREAGDSIGVYNVHMRLRLEYGDDYGIAIYSKPGEGTRIEAEIPNIEGGAAIEGQGVRG